ncbi:hypothetical protein R1sor_012135 [Riccia sorocarpa]|uniref:Fungal lipase-like domain-containing protein n=1 Tax=Riccia sorocarpa TaxID=122646 RepID=A0ABD3I930_9MARC
MAPGKGQAEDKAELDIGFHSDSDDHSGCWYSGENDPERDITVLLSLFQRSKRKALLRRLGGKMKSDEEVVTTTREFSMGMRNPSFLENPLFTLKFLAALQRCDTSKRFDSKGLEDLFLQPYVWEVLVKYMRGNYQLEEIVVEPSSLPAGSGRHIGELVKGAGNLKTFQVEGLQDELQEERFQQELAAIASSLQGHKHATLVNFSAVYVNDLTNVVKIISSAPHLSYISLKGSCSMDETTKVVLCAALKECSDLKRVDLICSSEGILEVLGKVYGQRFSDPQVSVLECLKLEQPKSLVGLACLAGSNICHLEITLNVFASMRAEKWVGRSLVRHPTLRVFTIELTIYYNDYKDDERDVQLGNELAEFWKASRKSPVPDIRVAIHGHPSGSVLGNAPLFVQDALKDTYLKEITFWEIGISPQVFKSFAELVGANTSVRSLQLVDVKIMGAGMSLTVVKDCWAHLFHHLRENTSIRTLELYEIDGLHDENFRDLMDVLQVNFILQEVNLLDTGWDLDGKSALVQAALERNAKLAGYFSVLGAAQLSFDGAKAGRIFLCGLPFAGKTQLKVTMMDCLGKTSRSESLIWTTIKETVGRWVPSLRRTEGIEVELFYDKEAMTISIWDFAGQQIFRPLQNILFPKISQACVFLFVFNPFNKVDEKIIGLKENVHDAFAGELRSWLRFIVSNTQITGRIRPQVIVVITHKDVLEKRNNSFGQVSVSEFENIVKDLQREFQDVVELCPECSGQEGKLVYHIDGTLKQDLEPITELVISSMKDVLSRKSPKVPRVCSDLVSFLLKRPLEVQTKPLWPCNQLYDFCLTNSKSLSHIDVTQEERGKVLHAIASYMHDAGAVCMTPRALMEYVGDSDADCRKLAVVDLNWLTQNLLGQLITLGHPAETMKGASVRRFRQVEVDADGLLNTQQLEDILHRVLSEQKDKEFIPMVKELLLELDLCYCLESGVGRTRYFFMPMLLGGGSEQVIHRPLSWEVDPPQGSSYFGYRIQCRDPNRTSLSPAFYPRYQIHLRKRMGVTLGVKDDNFTFRRSHVEIRVDGYCIFVETDVSSENHIDVLVQFCRPGSRDRIIDFIRRQIVQDLFAFCASEKGCPGVELVVAIIRTKCVENLTPKQLRTASQVVLVEDLKDTLKKNLRACVESKLGLETPAFSVRKLNELYQRGCQDSLRMREFLDALEFFCFHPWPRIATPDASQFGLVDERVCAVDLLSSEEVREIVQAVWKHHNEKRWPQEVAEGKAGPFQQLPRTLMEGRRISDELYEVYVPVAGDTNIELVFIHGLQKAVTQKDVYVSAWTVRNDENNCWLMSWLPKHIPTCRILSVSYDASKVKTSSEGRMDMYVTVENLVTSLVEFGRIGQKCPVILVGHSLGGLVSIAVCNMAHSFASLSDRIPYRNFCDNIKGLFFYSTPFSGVKLADLGAPRGVTFWGSEGGEAGDLMENLELFDKRTSRRNYEFAQLKRKYSWKTQCVVESCHTMFEGQASSSRGLFVDEGSARAPFMDDVNVISDTDHFSVCRPEEETSNNFQLLVHFVQSTLNQGPGLNPTTIHFGRREICEEENEQSESEEERKESGLAEVERTSRDLTVSEYRGRDGTVSEGRLSGGSQSNGVGSNVPEGGTCSDLTAIHFGRREICEEENEPSELEEGRSRGRQRLNERVGCWVRTVSRSEGRREICEEENPTLAKVETNESGVGIERYRCRRVGEKYVKNSVEVERVGGEERNM